MARSGKLQGGLSEECRQGSTDPLTGKPQDRIAAKQWNSPSRRRRSPARSGGWIRRPHQRRRRAGFGELETG